jgi:small conductance mechanosensitive channel
METTFMDEYQRIGILVGDYGLEMIKALVIIIIGLLLSKFTSRLFKRLQKRFRSKKTTIAVIGNIVQVILIYLAVFGALTTMGYESVTARRLLNVIGLALIGAIMIFRPYLPTLPFKPGDTIKVGDLFGKVEATTVLNTRIRTFDGKTIFIPNRKILNDDVQNYYYTPHRRIYLNINIRYDQDLMKAKQTLEGLMIKDPRVLVKPRPVVYVLNLSRNCVEIGGRCWIPNVKYWVTRCELLEKIKLRFDTEGVAFAFPQLDIHVNQHSASPVQKIMENQAIDDRLPGDGKTSIESDAIKEV